VTEFSEVVSRDVVDQPKTEMRPEAAEPPAAPPKHHHRLRVAVFAVVAVLVAMMAVVVFSYLFRSQPGPVSVGSAGRSFRATTTTTPTPKVFALPPAGVYRASGSGFEQIAVPPDTLHDSSLMPVTVSYLADGCWRWHLDYNTAHWHEYDFCPNDGRLLLRAQRNSLTVDLGLTSITNLAKFACNPPSPIVVEQPRIGEVFAHRCTGTNSAASGISTAAGPVTLVGVTVVDIGGAPVPAIVMTRHQKISGGQSGTLDEKWWFARSDGMPLRANRDYHLSTSSPIGSITYTETGSWQLVSVKPTVSGTTSASTGGASRGSRPGRARSRLAEQDRA
jgi:hypothetical protein